MYSRFGLTLVVNHACNLRCSYCYTGKKFRREMPCKIAERAVDRALQSLNVGGTLELAFFGGEPLIEAELIEQLIAYARRRASSRDVEVFCQMTTNGTLTGPTAWRVITHPQMSVAISHDGLPSIHDQHRIGIDGRGTAEILEATIRRLVSDGIDFRVVSVVRPDTLDYLGEGLKYLKELGVRWFDPSLDLWTHWQRSDANRLTTCIARLADLWVAWLPDVAISWYDSRAGQLGILPAGETTRCGFGVGEIAVAPSGNLYPCERLVGEDRPDNPMKLPGHALDGEHYLDCRPAASKQAHECVSCSLQSVCSTTCRCSNYIRTGDVARPDGLLCWFDQTCFRETARVLSEHAVTLA